MAKKVDWRPGSEPVTFRLDRTRMEQVAELRAEQKRTLANMVAVLIEAQLDLVFEERRKALKK